MDSVIEDVRVRKILDSRGNPTVEVDIITWNGFGRAAAPSGASTGSREVVSFPEGGVSQVITEVEDLISSELIGMAAEDIEDIDEILKEIDGTDNLSAIGGNTTVAVSMAAAKAAAMSYNLPLYNFFSPPKVFLPLGEPLPSIFNQRLGVFPNVIKELNIVMFDSRNISISNRNTIYFIGKALGICSIHNSVYYKFSSPDVPNKQ